MTPYDLLSGAIEPPRAAEDLYKILDEIVDKADSVHGDIYNTTCHHNEKEPLVTKNRSSHKKYDVSKANMYPPPVSTTLLDGTLV